MDGIVYEDCYSTFLRLFRLTYLDSKNMNADGTSQDLTEADQDFAKRQLKEFLKTFNCFVTVDPSFNDKLIKLQGELRQIKIGQVPAAVLQESKGTKELKKMIRMKADEKNSTGRMDFNDLLKKVKQTKSGVNESIFGAQQNGERPMACDFYPNKEK